MRILVLTPDFPPGRGGVQLLVGRLVANLPADEVTVVAIKPIQRVSADRGAVTGAQRLIELPRIRRLSQSAHVIALNIVGLAVALITRPDAVIAGHAVAVPAARVIARVLRRPYVLILHAQEISHRPGLTAAGVEHSIATVAVSAHCRDEAVRAGAPLNRIHVINPGVDPAKPRNTATAELPDRLPDRLTVLTIARMVDHYKGHDVMLEAIDQLRREIPAIQWVVAGDGPLRGEYEAEARKRGLDEHVTFAGAVSDDERDELLATADVFAMPSRVPQAGGGEGFGLVFLEAAANGLPVVAGDEGGARDSVVNGRTGLLVDPRDSAAVADAIRRLLTDRALASAMSAAARDHAARLNWPRFAIEVRGLFETAEHAQSAARVLAVSHTGAFGGAERSLLIQLCADATAGPIDVAIAAPPGPLQDRARASAMRVVDGPAFEKSFRVSPWRAPLVLVELLNAGRALAAVARSENATVLHANSVRAALIGIAARLFGGPPVIAHVRDCLPDSRMSRMIGVLTRRGSTHVVANSRYAAGAFRKIAGGDDPSVIYNAIDPAFTAAGILPAAPSGLEQTDGPLLTIVSQITPWKGQDVAIRALAECKAFAPAAKLAIAGSVKFSGDTRFENSIYERELHALCEKLGVTDDVIFLGELNDVRPLLAVSEIVLMPSWEEPFGRAAIEAMASSCAVIATNVGGPSEFIDHGVNGLLADPHDVAAWTAAVELLVRDPQLRQAIGDRARIDALRRFGTGSPETRMLHIYSEHAAKTVAK